MQDNEQLETIEGSPADASLEQAIPESEKAPDK